MSSEHNREPGDTAPTTAAHTGTSAMLTQDSNGLGDFNPVAFVAERTRSNSTQTVGERLSDIYLGALTIVILGTYAYGVTLGVGTNLTVETTNLLTAPILPDEARRITPAAVSWFVLLLATAAVLAACARFGPASLSRPQSVWWLPLPVKRGLLLAPSIRGFTFATIGIIAPLGVAANGLTNGWHLPTLLSAAVQGALYAATLVGVATYLQGCGVSARTFTRAATITALIALVLAAVLLGTPPEDIASITAWIPTVLPPLWPALDPFSSPPTLVITVAGAVIATTIAFVTFRRTLTFDAAPRATVGTGIDTPHRLNFAPAGLTSRGGNRAQLFNAVYLLKFDELRSTYQDLEASSRHPPKHHAPFRILRRLGPRAAQSVAQTIAEFTVYWRTPRILVTLLALTPIPILVAAMGPLGSTILVAIAALTCGIAMAHTAIGPSTTLGRSPALSALFPVSDRLVKVRSALVASVAVVPCYVLMWLPVTLAGNRNPLLLAAAAIAGIGIAAASVRLAVTPKADLTQPLVPGLMGLAQRGIWRPLIHGNDVAVIAQVPLAVAFILNVVCPQLFILQVGATVAALLISSRRPL